MRTHKLRAAIAALALSSSAFAVVLTGPPASTGVPSAFSNTDLEFVVGNGGPMPVAPPSGLWNGTFSTAVLRNTTTGFLEFWYQVVNNLPLPGTAPDSINRMTAIDFTRSFTDVGTRVDGAGIASLPVGLFKKGTQNASAIDRNNSGSTVGFDFKNAGNSDLDPGEASYIMVIKTHANAWKAGSAAIINGGSTNVAAFAPVPEPTFYGILGIGMAGLFLMARRRNAVSVE